ncbi:MAG: hypothetical protein ACOC6S_03155 [Chloroflexota bacterium]
MFDITSWVDIVILIVGYLVLLGTSGLVFNFILSRVSKEPATQKFDKQMRDTGFVVGKCENILVVTFMLLNAYTALAVIFAAKAIVRAEDMSGNSLFFLAGTMINITYSVTMGIIIKVLMGLI